MNGSLFLASFRRWLFGPSRAEIQQMWDEGEPVDILPSRGDFRVGGKRRIGTTLLPGGPWTLTMVDHSSLCALNATGHCGPCSCEPIVRKIR